MHAKLSRPLSAPGSPRDRSGMMTPGDFASLQEGREGLSTEDYIAWKLPEEEDPDENPFPLNLRNNKSAASSAGEGNGKAEDRSGWTLGGNDGTVSPRVPVSPGTGQFEELDVLGGLKQLLVNGVGDAVSAVGSGRRDSATALRGILSG